jgi:hypothetical protein
LVAFTTSKATEKLVEKMNLPTRYTEGGVVEVDSFLREKVFHIRLADLQSASQVSFISELLDFDMFKLQ